MQGTTRIIPTTYRAKIPSTTSWPIGAQELSDALADVPQFEEIRLTFSFYMTQKAMLNHWPSMDVVRFVYRKGANALSASNDMIERGHLERQWSISISAVPRFERKRLHDTLLQELPKARAWLTLHHTRQAVGGLSFKIIWDKQKDILYTSIEESAETERISPHREH